MNVITRIEADAADSVPSASEFVDRARRLSAVLRERADEAEQLRRMPDETVRDFLEAEFLRIMLPKRYGGCEYGWHVWCECLVELARGSASQAWAMMVHCEYVQMLGAFSQQAQDDVWLDDPSALISSSFQPIGKVEQVEGGYTIQTVGPKWGFSSGIDEASWLIVGGIVPGRGWTFFLVPKSAVTVHDDWHVAGLKGSGSKSFTIDQPVFVPQHRTITDHELNEGRGPGVTPDSTVISHYPRKAGASFGIAAVPLGAALGMLDDFIAGERARAAEKAPVDQATALRITESSAELSAAKRIMMTTLKEHWDIVSTGEQLTTEQRLDARRDTGFIALMAQRASQRLLSAAGASGIYSASSLQRQFRDVHAGANHMGVSWEMAATGFGEYQMGRQPAMGTF